MNTTPLWPGWATAGFRHTLPPCGTEDDARHVVERAGLAALIACREAGLAPAAWAAVDAAARGAETLLITERQASAWQRLPAEAREAIARESLAGLIEAAQAALPEVDPADCAAWILATVGAVEVQAVEYEADQLPEQPAADRAAVLAVVFAATAEARLAAANRARGRAAVALAVGAGAAAEAAHAVLAARPAVSRLGADATRRARAAEDRLALGRCIFAMLEKHADRPAYGPNSATSKAYCGALHRRPPLARADTLRCSRALAGYLAATGLADPRGKQ